MADPENQSRRFSDQELDEFRSELLALRKRIVGDVNSLSEETLHERDAGDLSHLPIHLADAGSDDQDQERALELLKSEQRLVEEIDAALDRIEDGSYGVCEATGRPISIERLQLIPWARYTAEAARSRERSG